MGDGSHDLTGLLRAWSKGDLAARDRLLPLVYGDLRRRAAAYMRRERRGDTLEPTALVHEAYLRLVDQNRVAWQNRGQFYGVASQMMRRIPEDRARTHRTALNVSVATVGRERHAERSFQRLTRGARDVP